jgi:hypothetical protein
MRIPRLGVEVDGALMPLSAAVGEVQPRSSAWPGQCTGGIVSVLAQDGWLKDAPHDLWFEPVYELATNLIEYLIRRLPGLLHQAGINEFFRMSFESTAKKAI